MIARFAALAAAFAAVTLVPSIASADCATDRLSCIELPDVPSRPADLVPAPADETEAMSSASAPTPLATVGDILPRGEYSLILNADYYGLPPVSDGWVYVRVGQDAFRVDWSSHEVLERVTDQAAANF
jgi:hypothetical protein